jgi:hypothetical protein
MPTNSDKWRFTLYTVIMVIVLFNKYAFKTMDSLIGIVVPTTDKNGCPTSVGFIIHLMIFTVVLRYSMDLE